MKFLKYVLIMKKFVFILLAVLAFTATIAEAQTGEVDTGTVYQELEGFGAAHVWSGSTLVSLGNNNPEIYDVLFADLGLDIVRLRNTYGYTEFDYDYIANCEHAITNARNRTGRPLKIMISSWSPPASLKSNNNINGGGNATLKKSSGNYVYDDFANWWADSLEQYASHGMVADYISIQNEPDWDPGDYESCRFEPSETSSIAGYNQAFEAVYSELFSRMGSSMPKMLAPETTGFQGAKGSSLSVYLSAMTNLSHVYGYAHHLYNCNDGGNAGCASNPDNYISNMTSFGNSYGNKPILQTEFSDDGYVTSHDACINLAVLMHNSLVEEGAAGYLYWQLTWGDGGLVQISADNWTINPIYYAMLHYSKFTDPGWRRVKASANSGVLRISAYLSPDNNELSVVVINTASNSTNLSLSLGSFSPAGSEVYQTSETEKAAHVGSFDESEPLTLPGRSITTISLTSVQTGTPAPNITLADVNSDGSIDIVDALLIAQYYVGLNPQNFNEAAADTNCDGSIDIVDALLLAQYYVGLIVEFC